MKAKQTTSLALAIALAAGMTTEALAGGDYYSGSGGIKDYGGTPVPAPIPVPVYDPVWYFRADAALGLGDAPSGSESGITFGEADNNYRALHTFGTDGGAVSSGYDQFGALAFGVGYRWNESFRVDVTGESRREVTYKLNDSARGTPLLKKGSPLPGYSPVPGYVQGDVDDLTTVQGAAFFVNAYYDLPTHWGGFTPYVGAGLGFAITDINRKNTTTERVHDRSTPSAPTTTEQYTSTSKLIDQEASFAAAVMLGTTYRISDITELDFNYRYLYIEGTDATLVVNGHTSTLSTDPTNDHQLRAGVRFNID